MARKIVEAGNAANSKRSNFWTKRKVWVGSGIALFGLCVAVVNGCAYFKCLSFLTNPYNLNCDWDEFNKIYNEPVNFTSLNELKNDPVYKEMISLDCGDINAFTITIIINETQKCGATFIDNDLAITAAHCVAHNMSIYILIKSCVGFVCKVIKKTMDDFRIIISEKYKREFTAHDMAFIAFNERININPACLPPYDLQVPEELTAVINADKSNLSTVEFNFINMTQFSNEICTKNFINLCKMISNFTICAGNVLENGTIIGGDDGEFF